MAKRCGRDLLSQLAAEPCNDRECEGKLERRRFKGTDAVVCTDCETPTLRVWEP